METPNIIIFGEPGVGKSSVINMLAGRTATCTQDRCFSSNHQDADGMPIPLRCRTQHNLVNIEGQTFSLHEATAFTPDGGNADRLNIVQAYTLIQRLKSGVSLLVFCMRAPRITEGAIKSWSLFNEIFCRLNVPIVAVITGLEHDSDLEAWYDRNRANFDRQGMRGRSGASITAIQGREDQHGIPIFQQDFNDSVRRVQALIKNCYMPTPWVMERVEWFNYYVPKVVDVKIFCIKIKSFEIRGTMRRGAMHDLIERCKMREEDARALAQLLHNLEDKC